LASGLVGVPMTSRSGNGFTMLTEHRSGDVTRNAAASPRKSRRQQAAVLAARASRTAPATRPDCTAGRRVPRTAGRSAAAQTTERKIIPFLAQKFLYRVLIDFTADERHEIRHTREEKNPLVSLKRTRRTSRLRAHRDLVAHMLMRSWLRS
jgi:hypothetical protein